MGVQREGGQLLLVRPTPPPHTLSPVCQAPIPRLLVCYALFSLPPCVWLWWAHAVKVSPKKKVCLSFSTLHSSAWNSLNVDALTASCCTPDTTHATVMTAHTADRMRSDHATPLRGLKTLM